jgi:hypothetical protein
LESLETLGHRCISQEAKRDGKLPEGVMPGLLQRLAEPPHGQRLVLFIMCSMGINRISC